MIKNRFDAVAVHVSSSVGGSEEGGRTEIVAGALITEPPLQCLSDLVACCLVSLSSSSFFVPVRDPPQFEDIKCCSFL